jgi:hypothetical protein
MRVSIPRFLNFGLRNILSDIQNQQISRTKRQKVVLERVPFGAHDGVAAFLCLLSVKEGGLVLDVFLSLDYLVSAII